MTIDLDLTMSDLITRLLCSLVIGIFIGLEREMQHKAAGLRTSVLICLGSTVFTIASIQFGTLVGLADPSRIAAQIVTGIGFLGAGTILQTRGSVHGLTTAATIWVMASLGLAVGLGLYALGFGSAILALIVLHSFQAIEHAVRGKKSTCTYTLKLSDTGPALVRIMKAVQQSPGEAKQLSMVNRHDHYELVFNYTDVDEAHCILVDELSKTQGVVEITADQGR